LRPAGVASKRGLRRRDPRRRCHSIRGSWGTSARRASSATLMRTHIAPAIGGIGGGVLSIGPVVPRPIAMAVPGPLSVRGVRRRCCGIAGRPRPVRRKSIMDSEALRSR
jgi:hypothetical protein